MSRRVLRPAGFDELGLKWAFADRMLPLVVAAMSFLAALGLAGWVGAAMLAQHWQTGAGASLTVQVPTTDQPDAQPARVAAVIGRLRSAPGVASVREIAGAERDALLRPWLGAQAGTLALPLPSILAVRLADPDAATPALGAQLAAAAPGTIMESHARWASRVVTLARSLE